MNFNNLGEGNRRPLLKLIHNSIDNIMKWAEPYVG